MHDDQIKGPLLTDGLGEQFFKGFPLSEITEGRLTLLQIFLLNGVPVLGRPISAGLELGLVEYPWTCSSEETRA